MRAKYLTDLITAVRQLTHTEFDQAVTDPEITDRINDAGSSLDDMLVGTYQHYRVAFFDFTLNGGVDTAGGTGNSAAALPADFYKDVFLDRNPTSSVPERVKPFTSLPERNSLGDRSYTLLGSRLVVGPTGMSAGNYRLCYTPLMNTLFNPAITLQTGDSVTALTKSWTFQAMTFDSSYVGATLVISGAANSGNNGTFTITSANLHTLQAAAAVGLVNETFNTATVKASSQPLGTVFQVEQIYLPWYEFYQLHAGLAVRDKFGLPVGRGIGPRLAAIARRIESMAQVRQEEGGQVPMSDRFGRTGFWLDDDGIYK